MAFQERIFKERLQRSKILGHPLLGDGGLVRERGMIEDSKTTLATVWARGLKRREIFSFENASSSLFAYDEVAGIYVTNLGTPYGQRAPVDITR